MCQMFQFQSSIVACLNEKKSFCCWRNKQQELSAYLLPSSFLLFFCFLSLSLSLSFSRRNPTTTKPKVSKNRKRNLNKNVSNEILVIFDEKNFWPRGLNTGMMNENCLLQKTIKEKRNLRSLIEILCLCWSREATVGRVESINIFLK